MRTNENMLNERIFDSEVHLLLLLRILNDMTTCCLAGSSFKTSAPSAVGIANQTLANVTELIDNPNEDIKIFIFSKCPI
jgi:hypothetical protein